MTEYSIPTGGRATRGAAIGSGGLGAWSTAIVGAQRDVAVGSPAPCKPAVSAA